MISFRSRIALLFASAQVLTACNTPHSAPATAPSASAPTSASATTRASAAATAPAPSTSGPAARQLLLSDADNGKTLLINNADTVVLNLNGNITTGYSWALAGITGSAIESLGDPTYTRELSGNVGSGGVFIAKFRVAKVGESQITLQYARPWEKSAPARTFTVTLVVDKLP